MHDALTQYEHAIEYNPATADNYFNKGNVMLNQEEFDKAHENFDEAIKREERNPKYYHAKGLAF
jgi:tetratricopeptide (TPR) repeat protein